MKPAGDSWGKYLKAGSGRRLSKLGERLGWDWLTYNRLHFAHFHDMAVVNAPGVIGAILDVFPAADRFADVGAGSGAFAAEVVRRGKTVVALERDGYGRRLAARQGVDARPFDLSTDSPADLPGGFDLAYCFEVAEHLPPALGDRLVGFLAALAPVVVFTAARPGQGGTGHINEQPPAYWLERFAARGMADDQAAAAALRAGFAARRVPAAWFHDNLIVVRRPA